MDAFYRTVFFIALSATMCSFLKINNYCDSPAYNPLEELHKHAIIAQSLSTSAYESQHDTSLLLIAHLAYAHWICNTYKEELSKMIPEDIIFIAAIFYSINERMALPTCQSTPVLLCVSDYIKKIELLFKALTEESRFKH